MKLYAGPLSLFSRKVEIALHEKGLAFERIMVPFSQAEGYAPKHPAVSAANPKGQVPVLVDGDLTLFDSTVILEYLDDAYPTPALYPADARERARCRLIELTADEILFQPVTRLMYRTSPSDSDEQRRLVRVLEAKRAEDTIRDIYGGLDKHIEGREYFCDTYSVGDIGMFMTILFVLRLGGPRLDAFASLAAWHRRVGARPAPARIAAEIAAADRALSVPVDA